MDPIRGRFGCRPLPGWAGAPEPQGLRSGFFREDLKACKTKTLVAQSHRMETVCPICEISHFDPTCPRCGHHNRYDPVATRTAGN